MGQYCSRSSAAATAPLQPHCVIGWGHVGEGGCVVRMVPVLRLTVCHISCVSCWCLFLLNVLWFESLVRVLLLVVCRSVYLSVCLPVCLCVWQAICWFVCLVARLLVNQLCCVFVCFFVCCLFVSLCVGACACAPSSACPCVSACVCASGCACVDVKCLGLVVPCASCFVGALLLLMSCYCGPCCVGLRHLCGYKLHLDRHVNTFSIGHLMAPGFLRGAAPWGPWGGKPHAKNPGAPEDQLCTVHTASYRTQNRPCGASQIIHAPRRAPHYGQFPALSSVIMVVGVQVLSACSCGCSTLITAMLWVSVWVSC